MKRLAKRFQLLLFLSLSILLLLQLLILFQSRYAETGSLTFINEFPAEADLEKNIVNITGAVKKPGIYSLKKDERVIDLINKAGGLTDNADQEFISKTLNSAEIPKDGSKYYIPFIANVNKVNILNINNSSTEELESLPGIGATSAEKIVLNRPYTNLDELKTKAEISSTTFNQIKDLISL